MDNFIHTKVQHCTRKHQHRAKNEPTDAADIIKLCYRHEQISDDREHNCKAYCPKVQVQPQLFIACGVDDALGFHAFRQFLITIHRSAPFIPAAAVWAYP